MKPITKKKLAAAGFRVGTVQDFLELSDQDMALIELKIRLVQMLKATRQSAGLTQHRLATLLRSSQSRVAKMEAGAADVTLDLLCKALFAVGVSRQAIGKTIAAKQAA